MSSKYSKEFKASIIARMLPPNNARVPELSQETGVPRDTLYMWRLQHRHAPQEAAAHGQRAPKYSSEDKLSIVIETASLSETELGEYCRRKGLYPEQVTGWKKAFIDGDTPGTNKAERGQVRQQNRMIKKLQGELRRKDKALAETAALLVLEKKLQALLGESEDGK